MIQKIVVNFIKRWYNMMNMNNLEQSFWKRLTDSRPDTLAVMAEKTGIPLATIKGWHSKGRIPKLEEAIALAEYLGVSLDWLLLGKHSESFNDRLIKSYRDSDDLTKQIINKLLKL